MLSSRHSAPASIALHPRGLGALALLQLWESFSFFGMKAVLVFYFINNFGLSDRDTARLYGAYTSLVYGMALVGGAVADRWLGARRMVLIGAVFILLGHSLLAAINVPDLVQPAAVFGGALLALALIAVGSGCFVPNVWTSLSSLYSPTDARRDRGFVLFYVTVNIGAAVAAILCGYLGRAYGWNYAFVAAGIGMAAGLLLYASFDKAVLKERRPCSVMQTTASGLVLIMAIGCAWLVLRRPQLGGWLLGLALLAAGGRIGVYALTTVSVQGRRHLLAIAILALFMMVFVILFEQHGSLLNLFADRNVRLVFGPLTFSAAQTQALNPLFVIAAGLIFVFWPRHKLVTTKALPAAAFASGLLLAALCFTLLYVACFIADESARIHGLWLVCAYAVLTVGELMVSPIGYAAVTRLAPRAIAGTMMGFWLLCKSSAFYIAAQVASFGALSLAERADTVRSLSIYRAMFFMLAIAGFAAAALLFALRPRLNAWLQTPSESAKVPCAE
jgi:proton-dependent oligopeptide transporter, POT family